MHLQAPTLPASYFEETRGIEGPHRSIRAPLDHKALATQNEGYAK